MLGTERRPDETAQPGIVVSEQDCALVHDGSSPGRGWSSEVVWSATQTVSRPCRFAAYSAESATRIRSTALRSGGVADTPPMLIEIWNGGGSVRNQRLQRLHGPSELFAHGAHTARPKAGQHDRELLAAVAGGNVRLTKVRAAAPAAMLRRTSSPTGWPNVSFTRLKLSTSIISNPSA